MSVASFVEGFFIDVTLHPQALEYFATAHAAAFSFAQTKAVAAAEPTIQEAKDVIAKLGGSCAAPPNKDFKMWSEFTLATDFPAALGVLAAVPGKALLSLQLQFVYLFVTFLVRISSVAHARAAASSRKDRKISDEMSKQLSELRVRIQDICFKHIETDLCFTFSYIDLFIHLFMFLSICICLYSFMCLIIDLFIYVLIHSIIHLCSYSCILIHSFIHSFIHSCILYSCRLH